MPTDHSHPPHPECGHRLSPAFKTEAQIHAGLDPVRVEEAALCSSP